jgi:hypothetical protein
MDFRQRDAENLRQLKAEGEADIQRLEQNIAAARQQLNTITAVDQGLTTNVPVHFIATIDLRNEVLVFENIKTTLSELRRNDLVQTIKCVVNPTAYLKYLTEFGALGFFRDESLEFLYSGAFVMHYNPGR